MPRLSLWNEKKSNDYQFIDRTAAEMYQVGGTGIGLHKYLGPVQPATPSSDATQPTYDTQSITNIQDILFLENRDRQYDPDVYVMRGVYQRADNDFDLSQFGLFLQNGTIVMTFHHNEMVDILGRRIISGDVIELFHLKDDDALNPEFALKRFYVAGDCSWATEGFSQTWWPHLWRVKFNPLVNSQEYANLLNQLTEPNTSGPQGTSTGDTPLADIMSTYNKYLGINNAIIDQANADVPKSGYDVSKIYSFPVDKDGIIANHPATADSFYPTSDNESSADQATFSPDTTQNPKGYLSGDGLAPNGLTVSAGVTFPIAPNQGDYYLRLDYLPNRLFRFDGIRWVKIEDNVRTNLTPGDPNNKTLRNSFANDTNTITLPNGDVIPESQGLSQVLRPKADY